MAGKKQHPTSGPEPDRLKIEGDWEEAVDDALKKPRPEKGWPKKADDGEEEGETDPDAE